MAVTAYKIKKALKGKNLTFVNVEKELNNLGYSVVLFNTPKGDAELARYNLEHKKHLKAFTYTKTVHIVFIDGSLHADDRLYLALHELGHIVLGHVGDGKLVTRNSVLIDIEADNFAHSIIKGKDKKFSFVYVVAIVILFSFILGTYYNRETKNTPAFTESINSVTIPEQETETFTNTATETVYVTPSGAKFHRIGCRYTKNKKLTELQRNEAEKKYSPCSVCNP